MAPEIPLAETTPDIVRQMHAGDLSQSEDRRSLLDQYGNVVATRVASTDDYDYYADVNQEFSPERGELCLSWDHGIQFCICVSWGLLE